MDERTFKNVEYVVWALIFGSLIAGGISALFHWNQPFVAILCWAGAIIWYHFKNLIEED